MKIAITTQFRENYGSPDEPYWKMKGGAVYIVPKLTPAQALKAKESGIPTLKALIESSSPMQEEYVVDWAIVDNDAAVCEEWEEPWELYYIDGRWIANRTVDNTKAYGYMRSEIARKTEEYDMLPGGERANYRAVYTMVDGAIVDAANVGKYFKEAA